MASGWICGYDGYVIKKQYRISKIYGHFKYTMDLM